MQVGTFITIALDVARSDMALLHGDDHRALTSHWLTTDPLRTPTMTATIVAGPRPDQFAAGQPEVHRQSQQPVVDEPEEALKGRRITKMWSRSMDDIIADAVDINSTIPWNTNDQRRQLNKRTTNEDTSTTRQ